ncbi:MAG: ECF transporter S component [Bacilli bacterium]|jgi:energy-coupling factor transport system substrate-specific component|nr:ECF transporter S component [Bacilli bacterium]
MFRKSSIITFLLIIIILLLALFVFKGNNYLLSSSLLVMASCLPFYYKYEKRKPEPREFIIIVIMCALAISNRLAFAFLPAFKPLVAIIIITGASFGCEAGFMCGSLSALVSNMFFGQGPWTLYQTLIWGLIGFGAGLLNRKQLLENKLIRYFYGLLVGGLFSISIDFLTAIGSGYTNEKFLALFGASLPFMIYYALSNVLFLYFLYEPITKKLTRVKLKYGIVDEKYRL